MKRDFSCEVAMTRIEQHKMILELRDCLSKMSREDLREVEMLLKRDKDDEELDVLSVKKLEELHARYAQRKSKKDIEERWKKMTGGS